MTDSPDWDAIRAEFNVTSASAINLASMVVGSSPRVVADAVARHRNELNASPWGHLKKVAKASERAAVEAIGRYFGISPDGIALTTGTTQGLALLYAGIRLEPGQEILTTAHEFSAALRVMDWRHRRDGVAVRKLLLLPDPFHPDDVLKTLENEIRPTTRVLALTWVYSNSGLRLPIETIGQLVARINCTRTSAEHVLLCVDGVHGFGVEGTSFSELGCAAFVAGCHKWACGPRGTGIWCATRDMWDEIRPLIPTSSDRAVQGLGFSPGGVQAYEHIWALRETVTFLESLGPAHVRARVHELASRAKDALLGLGPKISLITPVEPEWSAGIVCFDVNVPGLTADTAVAKLEDQGVLASVSSLDEGRPGKRHVRFSFSVFNTREEVDRAVAVVDSL